MTLYRQSNYDNEHQMLIRMESSYLVLRSLWLTVLHSVQVTMVNLYSISLIVAIDFKAIFE